MSLKVEIGHVDVVKQGDGYDIRIWNGDSFDRLGKSFSKVGERINSLKKEQLISIRDSINKIVEG